LGLVAALATSSYGAGFAWYEAVATSPNASVVSQGQGQTLLLECDKLVAPCTWNVTLKLNMLDGGAAGWALDLGNTNTDKVSVANANVLVNAVAAAFQTPGTIDNAGGILMQGQAGGNATGGGAPAGLYDLMTFTLSKGPGTNLGVTDIFAAIGGAEFGGNDPGAPPGGGADVYEVIGVGPNAPRAGYSLGGASSGAYEALPVISIRNIPEPATLSLLGLGALSLIRRRK
jgi:hypothetical protein